MTSLKDHFDDLRGNIEDLNVKGVYHYSLIEIMRKASSDGYHYDEEGLRAEGIEPAEFVKVWATGYAKETLGWYESVETIRDPLIKRCETCLSTTGTPAFGLHLPEPVKLLIQQKLDRLRPPEAQPAQP